ncbi:response regulator transcription factor [Acetobacterium bakii]|uniref:Stage 0 sporulation protein A homolog n=1 Tax=Acetobacterium bakii TaxID=52689 RepID=A0A0L6TV76_9FIRM|nr:response regulator transcription factor [Acetobacterium bakii]KNZ40176.1 DNA-binding protein [Acetobacterium bakii]
MKTIFESKLLVVDDEPEILIMVKKILNQAGYFQVVTAENCQQARDFFDSEKPQCVILDVMLPDGDGFSLMQELRRKANVPMLFLSARDEDENRLLGLGLGADDYITKPFLPRELVLRLSGILRRVYQPMLLQPNREECLILGAVTINFNSGIVKTGAGEKTLTAKEHALLKKLWENQGNIVTADSLCRSAWDDDLYGYENTLMVHIRRLREKIEADPSKPQYLLTIRGMGYKLAKERNR